MIYVLLGEIWRQDFRQISGKKGNVHEEKTRKFPAFTPYIKVFSEEIRQVLQKFKIPTYFKPTNTLRQLLVRPMDQVDKEHVVKQV